MFLPPTKFSRRRKKQTIVRKSKAIFPFSTSGPFKFTCSNSHVPTAAGANYAPSTGRYLETPFHIIPLPWKFPAKYLSTPGFLLYLSHQILLLCLGLSMRELLVKVLVAPIRPPG